MPFYTFPLRGPITARHLRGPITARHLRGPITARRLRGPITARHLRGVVTFDLNHPTADTRCKLAECRMIKIKCINKRYYKKGINF